MRCIFAFFLILTACFFLVIMGSPAAAGIEEQRQIFLKAEQALKSGRVGQAGELLSKLENYPLYPYLVYEQLQKNISLKHEERILQFLKDYDSSPLADSLRQKWLGYLARSSQWDRLVRDYRNPSSQTLQCSYARGLMETGRMEHAWKETEKLWLHGRSRPRECDAVFNRWRSNGLLTDELTWQRIELSIAQGQMGMAGYLRRYLSASEQSWLDLWLDVINRPSRTLTINWSEMNHPAAEKILAQGMSRLIRTDTQKALEQWQEISTRHDLSALNTDPVKQELGLFLALRKHPEALQYLGSLSQDTMTPRLRQWHVRAALYHSDWVEALSALDKMHAPDVFAPQWIYWRARVLEELGRHFEARNLYQSIQGRQSYFALLAADRINAPYTIEHRAISSTAPEILQVRQDMGLMRAQELFYLGRLVEARREWNASLSSKSQTGIRAAAILAHDMGWHDRAIVAAANAREFDDLVIRFPVSYSDLITSYSSSRGLDPSWVFALARQESMFMPDVGSPAGALGIMQIMPATGRQIASAKNMRFGNLYMLLNPETNIRFGTYYLKKRLDQLQGNPVLATAAYNAGAHRVRAWLPGTETMAADIWVENIPFNETRDYVEKVLTYKVIYQMLLGISPTRVASLMPDILGTGMVAARAEQ